MNVSRKLLFGIAAFSFHAKSIIALAIASPRTVLVTGGAGYIGSHTCLELLNEPDDKYRVIVLDNLDNSSEESLKRVQALTKCAKDRLVFRQGDLRDKERLAKGKLLLALIHSISTQDLHIFKSPPRIKFLLLFLFSSFGRIS